MHFTKHQALGNDFLVLLDREGVTPVEAGLVRSVCDRHRGVGADGLLHVTAADDDLHATMNLYTADGSRAEISGNGLACLAQAVTLAEWVSSDVVCVATAAGPRSVRVEPSGTAGAHLMTVDMGVAAVEGDEPEWVEGDILRALRVSMGNPHLVLHVAAPDAKLDLDELGRAVNDHVAGGINVEAIWPGPDAGELTMEVYERGVGLTEACGSGACAAAVAAKRWELAGDRVRVHMPGGATEIEIGESIRMTTPVVWVADIEFHEYPTP
ncbi:MAG: diaminopimelate epimerase [Acidimicrobiales bacterium]